MLLLVSGGRPTADMSVRETDVRTLLAPAINMAIDAGDNMNREEDIDRDYLYQFYGEYTATVDQSGPKPKFTLQDKTVPLKGNNGLRLIYDGCNYYGRLNDADRPLIKYYEKLTPCMRWYNRVGQTVYLHGVDGLLDTISYEALTDINDLGDDDELPMVAGTEARAIDILYRLVTGQMENPYDKKIDHDDVNKSAV